MRVYEEDARAAAARADARLADGDAPPLCGVPVALKDLYAVAGKPLTASSRVLDEVPQHDSVVWARLVASGMVLLGHVHTHEFAAGGTTDQVANPWALDRSAGGSSGGSAAALAARLTPAATGTDTAGSLRIPSALCGTSTIKPTRGLVPLEGVVPLAPTLDHAGPMARTVADCRPLLAAMAAVEAPATTTSVAGVRVAISPRVALVKLDADVADGFDAALDALPRVGATVVELTLPPVELDLGSLFIDLVCGEMLEYHRRFADRRALYRPSIRGFLEHGEAHGLSPPEYAAAQARRVTDAAAWVDALVAQRVDALVEPTVPCVAPLRGPGYDVAFSDAALVSLTHYWNWLGFPVVALPAGVGSRSDLPVGVSLIGRPGADWSLLDAGIALQSELGVPELVSA